MNKKNITLAILTIFVFLGVSISLGMNGYIGNTSYLPRLGVGLTNPSSVFEVNGTAKATEFFGALNYSYLRNMPGNCSSGYAMRGLDGNCVQFNNGTLTASMVNNGSVTSVTCGTGLTGGTFTTSGTCALNTTGASAGTYGGATTVGQFTLSTDGRITSASNVAISGVGNDGNITGSGSNLYIPRFTNNSNIVPSIIFQDSTGFIGIGTIEPKTKLHVNGTINASEFSGALNYSYLRNMPGNCSSGYAMRGLDGNCVQFNNGTLTASMVNNGSVTSVNCGTGLTGGNFTTSGTCALNTTGASAGTYGGATTVGQFTLSSDGRITSVSNISITAGTGNITGTGSNMYVAIFSGTNTLTNGVLYYDGITGSLRLISSNITDGWVNSTGIKYRLGGCQWSNGTHIITGACP